MSWASNLLLRALKERCTKLLSLKITKKGNFDRQSIELLNTFIFAIHIFSNRYHDIKLYSGQLAKSFQKNFQYLSSEFVCAYCLPIVLVPIKHG